DLPARRGADGVHGAGPPTYARKDRSHPAERLTPTNWAQQSAISADNGGVRPSRFPALTLALGCVLLWTLVSELDVLTPAAPLHGLALGRPAHLITDAAAGALCAIAAFRHRGAARLAWLLVAAGILAWTAGDSYWTFVLLNDAHIPVPSPADVGYLIFPV